MNTQGHMWAQMGTHKGTKGHTGTYTCTHTHTHHMHTYTHTRTHAHTHSTHVHAHPPTHTRMRQVNGECSSAELWLQRALAANPLSDACQYSFAQVGGG